MAVTVTNAQREAPVNAAQVAHVARCALRRLRIRSRGTFAITFIGSRRMRALNKRFLHHDRVTDVLSFRYESEPVAGEILIAPRRARAYAAQHGIPYREELARYVVHGLLHWRGLDDRTAQQQRKMRQLEDWLLGSACAGPTGLASRDIFIFRRRKQGRKIETSRTP